MSDIIVVKVVEQGPQGVPAAADVVEQVQDILDASVAAATAQRNAAAAERVAAQTARAGAEAARDATAAAIAAKLPVTPEEFLAVGDGVTDDTAAVQAAADAALATGRELAGERGKEYRVSSLTTRVSTKLNLVVANNGQTSAPIVVAPKAADVETPSLASINALVAAGGWNKGSSQLTGLTNARGWSYAFNSSDAVILSRLGGGSLNIGESFLVTTDAGGISPALVRDYTTFTDLTITRQRFRPTITIQINVRVVTGSGSTLNSVIRCDRSNTIFTDSHTLNQSGGQVQQGFVASNCVHVVYENCTVDGLKVDVTNYGFNSNYSSDLTYRDCVTPECRRGIDGHAAKNVRVEGGQHPSGVGGHWVDDLLITDGAVIGNQAATTNPGCVTVAGSNVRADGAEFVMARRGAILTMRADLPSLEGICHVTNSKIVLYDDDDSLGPSYVSLMYLGGHTTGHDTGKAVYLPSNIKLTGNHVIQRGAASDNPIRLLHIGDLVPPRDSRKPSSTMAWPKSAAIRLIWRLASPLEPTRAWRLTSCAPTR